MQEFLSTRLILKRLDHTFLSLIPKKTHNPAVSNFRPIAYTNVVYKTITKILANRINSFLDKLIDPVQSTILQGRSITDNFFLAQELIRNYGRMQKITLRCMLKIDLQKTYDTISWDFLRDVLYGLNFHPCFVHWVMTCVTSATFSISINAGTHGFIKGQRGLRQGNVARHFLVALEYLSQLLVICTRDSDFHHHVKCFHNNLTHLAFVDDLLLFSRGDPVSMKVMVDCLEEFTLTSGLKINKNKLNIFMAGVQPFEKQ